MNKNKQYLFIFLFSLPLMIFYFTEKKRPSTQSKKLIDTYDSLTHKKQQTYTTFYKKGKNLVNHPSTQEELKKAFVGPKKRGPASVNGKYTFEGRLVIGDTDQFENKKKDLQVKNKANPDWKSLLASELLRFLEKDNRVIIEKEKSLVKVHQNEIRFVEQVVISLINERKGHTSFRALVDSESGSILSKWDRVHTKGISDKPLLLAPTGGL